jgi:predicted restriction endonuclease
MEAKNMRALKSLYYTKQQCKSRGGHQAAPNEKTKQQQAYQHAHSRSDYTSSSQKNQHIVKNMNISDLVSKFKQYKEE